MSADAVKLEIYNSALNKLGQAPLTSLAATTKTANLLNAQYPLVKKRFLRGHIWNFSLKRDEFTENATAPNHEYSKAFDIPEDCIRVLRVYEGDTWQREGSTIVADYSEINALYIHDPGEDKYDASFIEALAYQLAYDMCYAITQSSTMVERLKIEARDSYRDARFIDAQESGQQRVEADGWINARR